MGKRKQIVNYDKEALKFFAARLQNMRKPVQDDISQIQFNMEKLEELIKNLPNKEREFLERFWGFIPGTPNRMKNASTNMRKEKAFKNMIETSSEIMKKMLAIDNIFQYDEDFQKLVSDFVEKINKNGFEKMSDMDVMKYLVLYFIFMSTGHQMIYDGEDGVSDANENAEGKVDFYTLLYSIWETTKFLPDRSINLKLLVSAIEMFDISDVNIMKQYVGLPVSKEYEPQTLNSLGEIRRFKERIFSLGGWDTTFWLIYHQGLMPLKLDGLAKGFNRLRKNWDLIQEFKFEEGYMETSSGRKTVDCYKIGELMFTDPYEVQFLYLNSNLL